VLQEISLLKSFLQAMLKLKVRASDHVLSVKLQIRVSWVTVIQILMSPKSKSTVIVTGFITFKLALGNFIPKRMNGVYFQRYRR
jgi:hypothetical protein